MFLVHKNHLARRDNFSAKNSYLTQNLKQYLPYCLGFVATIVIGIIFTETVLAVNAQYNINAGITAGTKPAIDAVRAHWGKGVLLTSCGAAIWGEGDPRQRAVRAAVGAGASGTAVLGILAMLG